MFTFVRKQFGTIPATRRDAWGGRGRTGAHRATMTRPRHHHALLLALALLAPGPAAAQPPGARVYVTNNLPGGLGGNSVSVIDAGANTLVATIPVGVGPFGIAVSPDGTRAYVANEGGDTVSVIDTAANTVVATVTDVPGPKAVAVSPDGSLVYVTRTGWDRIALIDTATNTVVDDLQIADPWYLAFTPNGVTL
jgi:YVTN family beta-propeller protein